MLYPYLPPNPTLIERWGQLVYWLFEGMSLDWRRRGLRHVHHGEITQRIMGLWKRLHAVLRRWEAGTLRAAGRAGVAATPHPDAPPQGGREQTRTPPAWSVLPRRFGWLWALLTPPAQGCVVAFQFMLEEPQMQAVMAAAPQVGRIIRPFCHLLGIETPAALVLPKRKRVRTLTVGLPAAGEEEFARITAAFPDTPAARRAKQVWRRVIAGKKVDLAALPPVVAGYMLHPPRDGNCPLPEIGYGGRSFPPLPKDYEWPKDEE
jgi:hypothetical protein